MPDPTSLPEAEQLLRTLAGNRSGMVAVNCPSSLGPVVIELDRLRAVEQAARRFVAVANDGPLIDDAAALLALRRALGGPDA